MKNQHVLVVGVGFAGAVYARTLAEAGVSVQMIDKRDHIGGNAFDFVDENGIRVHAYGPHLFHTKNQAVIDWITQFGEFVPYSHKVRAKLPNGAFAPLPINLETVNLVFGTEFATETEVRKHLVAISEPIENPANAAEYLYSKIGKDLTDLFFRPYTKKMWALDLEDMSSSVVKRIPLRYDYNETYFADDEKQMMPRDGYTALFTKIIDHENIKISLNAEFDKSMEKTFDYIFNSMPIDEYFSFEFGELPYRSVRFHSRSEASTALQPWSVSNFTDNGPYTRETSWHALPCHIVRDTGVRTITKEEPCDYRDNGMERYYPVKTADGRFQATYEKYRERAAKEKTMSFIGRCGTYQYLDMDQVINQSLVGARKWLQLCQSF
jgi:UDP-galactopyranose mutase